MLYTSSVHFSAHDTFTDKILMLEREQEHNLAEGECNRDVIVSNSVKSH